jgi:NADH-quinone oxidoreductase subunit M
MSIYAVTRVLVLLLVLLPLVAAAVLPLFGRFARRVALVLALLNVGVAIPVCVVGAMWLDEQSKVTSGNRGDETLLKFRALFVPGEADDGTAPGRAATGSAGRTKWTLFRVSATDAPPDKPGPRVQPYFALDGLNLWLVALAALLLPVAVLVSWESVREKPHTFYALLFLLHGGMVGAFLSFDAILFYAFFELTLIPAFFLIGRWGTGSGRRDAARKFFLYTLAASLFTLVGIVGVAVTNPTPLHPVTKVRVPTAVVSADSSLVARNPEFVSAERGPITFSVPDLMHNVQVWAGASTAGRAAVANAEERLRAARDALVPAERASAAARATLDALRATKPTPEQLKPAQEAVVSAENALATARATVAASERVLVSARAAQVEADRAAARSKELQFWFFFALMAGFLVKVPVFPFHTWLPAAYGAAPAGVVAILSAVMAKLGTFGIMRLVLPLTPDAVAEYGLPVIGTLAAIGIVYGALCAYASTDIKMVLAYSSVSHLGLLVLGLFACNKEGLSGAVLHMVNHGISTGALFAALGFLIDRYGTTEGTKFGGLMGKFPVFAVLAFVLCLASVGLPGLNNFVSEMLLLAGVFAATVPAAGGWALVTVGAAGVFLSAWYTFTMMRRVFFQQLKEPALADHAPLAGTPKGAAPEGTAPRAADVSRREFCAFGSLAVLCLVLGLLPQLLLDTTAPDVRVLANVGGAARARLAGVPYVSDEPLAAGDNGPAFVPPALKAIDINPKGGNPKGGNPKGGNPKGGGGPPGPKGNPKGANPKAEE